MLAYPDDADARALYALSVLGTCHDGRDVNRYMKAAAVVEEIYQNNPDHPGALHYLIHAYDDPIHAPLGLRAARRYSQVAQRAEHALHMPTHIFAALGMWEESAALNEQSWQASLRRQQRKGLGAEARGYHARVWEHYAFLQQGRLVAAQLLVDELTTAPGTVADGPLLRVALATVTAHQIVAAGGGDPGAVIAVLDVGGPTGASLYYAQLVAALDRGERATAEGALRTVSDMLITSTAEDWLGRDEQSRIIELEMRALLALEAGDTAGAIKQLGQAAAIEDGLPFDYGPPNPVKPAHELLADVLHETGDAVAAVEHYDRALERTPGRAIALLGLARAARTAGDNRRASAAYAQLRVIWANADDDLAELAEVRAAMVSSEER